MSFDFSFPSNTNANISDDGPRSYEQELFEATPYLFRLVEVSDEPRMIANMETRSFRFAALDLEHNEVCRFYTNLRMPSNYDHVPSDKHWMIHNDVRVIQELAKARCAQKHIEQSFVIDDLHELEGYTVRGEIKARSYINKSGGTSWGYSILYPKAYTLKDRSEEFAEAKQAFENDDIPF